MFSLGQKFADYPASVIRWGTGVREYKPAAHHAVLIVNSAMTFSNFIFDTYAYQRLPSPNQMIDDLKKKAEEMRQAAEKDPELP
jgi:hypothetical protein